jgi:hypothetical protein
MKEYSEELVSVFRGFLCNSDYPTLQYVGQFGTDDEVVDDEPSTYVGPANF